MHLLFSVLLSRGLFTSGPLTTWSDSCPTPTAPSWPPCMALSLPWPVTCLFRSLRNVCPPLFCEQMTQLPSWISPRAKRTSHEFRSSRKSRGRRPPSLSAWVSHNSKMGGSCRRAAACRLCTALCHLDCLSRTCLASSPTPCRKGVESHSLNQTLGHDGSAGCIHLCGICEGHGGLWESHHTSGNDHRDGSGWSTVR